MRNLLVLAMVLGMVGVCAGHDLGNQTLNDTLNHALTNRAPSNQVPTKDDAHISQQAGNNPRQGGDTVDDATPIGSIPFSDSGTTDGYNDNYDEACPYEGSSKDVVYSLTASGNNVIDVDLCGSAYDTKVYVYDEGLNLVACNDDFYFDDICGLYVSKLENVSLIGGDTYYIVIDGYYDSFGDYELAITESITCVVECPDDAVLEGEPEIMDGYVDEYNSGCIAPGGNPLDYVQVVQDGNFCAVSGWYDNGYRDTDWFRITLSSYGYMIWTCDAEQPTYMIELLNMPDCANVEVGQTATAGPCLPATLTIFGEPNADVYFWVGPTTFYPPVGFIGHEYVYINFFEIYIIATEDATWSQLKAMYR